MKNKTIILIVLASIIAIGCLVAVSAIGILAYLGAFSMEQDVAAICKLRPTGLGLDCTTVPYFDADNNKVELTVVNGNPWQASNITADLNNSDCTGFANPSFSIQRGESKVVTITGCTFTSGERYDLVFPIEYTDENGQTHSNNAKISATAS